MNDLSLTFNAFNEFSPDGIKNALSNFNKNNYMPIFICVGSDLVLGDSLGPLVGTMLKKKKLKTYIYGNLNFPITAKEVEYAKTYIKQMHKESFIVAIDAAVGEEEDVGLIRVNNKGLKPGAGAGKNLGVLGDASIIGIVNVKSTKNYNLFNLTRLNLVYRLAEKIADGIEKYILSLEKQYQNKNAI